MVSFLKIMALLECVSVVRLFRFISYSKRQPIKLIKRIENTRHCSSKAVSEQSVSPDNVTKTFKMSRKKGSRDGLGKPKGYYDTESRYILQYGLKSGKPDKILNHQPYTVLGIESSCDDTGVAVVSSDGTILSNIVYSQYEIHERFGGVVPSLAMEAHKNNINKAVDGALAQAGLSSVSEVDAIAVTKGPGLEVCLRVGLRKAQELSRLYNKPLVTVHHLEAHCMVARMAGQQILSTSASDMTTQISIQNSNDIKTISNNNKFKPKIEYPFLTLLASGGHTSILLCRGLGDHIVLGGTLDDALGEAFDKVSRMLGIKSTSSGGAAVEQEAKKYIDNQTSINSHYNFNNDPSIQALNLKVPMKDKPNCDFSYAGLKNAFRMAVTGKRSELGLDTESTNAPSNQMESTQNFVTLPPESISLLCAGFQDVAFQHVEDRLKRSFYVLDKLNLTNTITGLVVVGGVASNQELRRRLLTMLEEKYEKDLSTYQAHVAKLEARSIPQSSGKFPDPPRKLPLVFPPVKLCTDNGVMVAWTGIEKLNLDISDEIEGQESIARWPFGNILKEKDDIYRKYT